MGIINATPDSFYEGSRCPTPEEAVETGLRLLAEGADILDIGGESTRPGAEEIPEEEERRRVLPVVERLRAATAAPLSVDTRKAGVAAAALAAGADIVNDVTGLADPRMREAILKSEAAAVIMHMQGEPRTMQTAPRYEDVVGEVRKFLQHRAAAAIAEGMAADRIIIDPGFGFGKTFGHNAALLMRGLTVLARLGYPVLAGLSRKSLIHQALGLPPGERLEASLALALLAAERGAAILRVHDVMATVRAVRMWEAVRAAGGENA